MGGVVVGWGGGGGGRPVLLDDRATEGAQMKGEGEHFKSEFRYKILMVTVEL